jgi:ABC-2 type transport system ATP-binding protein
VLISSQHLDEVARVADRITVINNVRAIGSPDPAGTDIERAFFSMVDIDDEAHQS